MADTSTTQAHASGRPSTGAAVESQPSRTVFSLGAKLAVTVAVLLVVLAGYLFYSPIQYHGSSDIPVRCGSAASPVKSRFIQGYCGDLNSIRRDQAIAVLIAALVVAAGGIIAFGVSRQPVGPADDADATSADTSGRDDRVAGPVAGRVAGPAAGAGPDHPAWSNGAEQQVGDVEAGHDWAPRDRYAGQEPAPPASSAAAPDEAAAADRAAADRDPDAGVQADRSGAPDRADEAGDVAGTSDTAGTDRATTRRAAQAGSSYRPPPGPAAARRLDPSWDHPKASDEDQVIP